VCGPLPKLIKANLTINALGPTLKIENDNCVLNVYMDMEYIFRMFGTCVQVIRVIKWNNVSIITQENTREFLKSIHSIISVMPGIYENLEIDCK